MGLTEGYTSPYFDDSHRALAKAARKFVAEVLLPEANAREQDGKPITRATWDGKSLPMGIYA